MDLENKDQQTQGQEPEIDPIADTEELTEADFLQLVEDSFDYNPPRRGEIRKATILQIDRNEIIVDMGAKQDGIVTSKDIEHLDPKFLASLEVGQVVPVFVLQPRDKEGHLIVSINMGLQQNDWEEAARLKEDEEVIPVRVTGYNKGGVLVRWRSLEGFIPASHMVTVSPTQQGQDRRDALEDLRRSDAEALDVKVIEVNPERRRLIFSEREAQREIRAQKKAELLEALSEGKVVRGTVTGLRDFGAFVNIGDADGLIHVSELAWHRVDHPSDVLAVGDQIDVFILNLDRETNRIALSRKRLLEDPWEHANERYYEGQLVEGTVTNVVDFGAFIALDDGLEGLLHLSEMGDGSLKEPYSYVKKGDRLQLRISRLEPERRRVGFTQRWGTEVAESDEAGAEAQPAETEKTEETQQPEAEVAPTEAVAATAAEASAEAEAEAEPVPPTNAETTEETEAEPVPPTSAETTEETEAEATPEAEPETSEENNTSEETV